MKRFINDGYDVVEEMLEGYVQAHHEDVRLSEDSERVVVSKHLSETPKVGIIFGGGSGHEPLFLGYVGKGVADAAVIGNVNTSPDPVTCYQAVKEVDQGKGVLYLYGNYQGDVINFDMGAEMAEEEGHRVETVLITDDVYSSPVREERRGVAGDVIVLMAACAAANAGKDLDEVKAAAIHANESTYSLGVALSSSTLPVTGEKIFEIGEDEMEVGMGIHGEPGIIRKKIEPADQVVDEILSHIIPDMKLESGEEVAVLINGLGALPLMDQYIMYRRVHQVLTEKGVKVVKSMVGDYATSMDMIGGSITLVRLDATLKEQLNAPFNAPYLKQ
ncbi:MAG: dihydroxyacetone kinase subunit DhaK [Erysipelothrix sp.]|nr:dihydroxyacetone kinase subunit DhaK [Erysipelothrix sp.]